MVNPKGLPECVCQRYCTQRSKPICGTDGMIYKNHCELHRAACILERPITLQKLEKCTTIGKKKQKKMDKHKTNIQPISGARVTQSINTVDITTTPFAPSEKFSFSDTVPQQSSTSHFKQSPYIDEIQFENSPNQIDTETTSYTHNGYCSSQEYEIMKDNLLLYSHTRLISQDNNSKDFLVSIMFTHYDHNKNNFLDEDELQRITAMEHLENLSNGCGLSDMLIFDDSNNDRKLSTHEFYQAFNKLYSKYRHFSHLFFYESGNFTLLLGLSVVSLDKALETNHLSARVGDNVEIKCDVTGSPVPIPIIWKRYSTDLTMLSEDEVI